MSEIVLRKAVLVSIAESTGEVPECERSLDELERLLDTAGGSCYAKVIQVKEKYDPRTCIGSGKVKEIKELCSAPSFSVAPQDTKIPKHITIAKTTHIIFFISFTSTFQVAF